MATQNLKKTRGILPLLLVAVFAGLIVILSSCSAKPTPSPQAQIEAAVAATLANIPTYTPYPLPTEVPTPTPFSLDGVFCEYSFCLGHPADVYLLDDGARRNPPVPSGYTSGVLFGYTQSLFLQFTWRVSDPNFDAQSAMRLVLEESEQFQGNFDVQLFGDLNVYYQPITTVTTVLPYGAIATWQCGGRDFMWKVYTPQDGMAPGLLKQALEKFRCS
jgi:hypothetical protein